MIYTEVNVSELEAILREDKKVGGNRKTLVLLTHPDCHSCQSVISSSSEDERSERLGLDIKFLLLDTSTEEVVFAPPLVPAVVAFNNGVRDWEGLGYPEDTAKFWDDISLWLSGSEELLLSIKGIPWGL